MNYSHLLLEVRGVQFQSREAQSSVVILRYTSYTRNAGVVTGIRVTTLRNGNDVKKFDTKTCAHKTFVPHLRAAYPRRMQKL